MVKWCNRGVIFKTRPQQRDRIPKLDHKVQGKGPYVFNVHLKQFMLKSVLRWWQNISLDILASTFKYYHVLGHSYIFILVSHTIAIARSAKMMISIQLYNFVDDLEHRVESGSWKPEKRTWVEARTAEESIVCIGVSCADVTAMMTAYNLLPNWGYWQQGWREAWWGA